MLKQVGDNILIDSGMLGVEGTAQYLAELVRKRFEIEKIFRKRTKSESAFSRVMNSYYKKMR